ncbi:hypothetical protein VTK26DRAFT_7517 [Humicola hyalothermophila]
MATQKQFNVGIIGYGLSAKIFHIPFIERTPSFKLRKFLLRHIYSLPFAIWTFTPTNAVPVPTPSPLFPRHLFHLLFPSSLHPPTYPTYPTCTCLLTS